MPEVSSLGIDTAVVAMPNEGECYHDPNDNKRLDYHDRCRVCSQLTPYGCFFSGWEKGMTKEEMNNPLCPFTKLLQWLRAFPASFLEPGYNDDIGSPDYQVREMMRRAWPTQNKRIEGWCLWSREETGFSDKIKTCVYEVSFSFERKQSYQRDVIFRVYTEAGSRQIPGFIKEVRTEPVGARNDGEDTWSFVRQRRDICKEHTLCNTAQPRDSLWLPPRLLKIMPHGLQLVESGEIALDCRYIALSYCWGKSQSLCTTAVNITDFYKEIPQNVLPAVIRDTVAFSIAMGENFLWIDRLCIQQDDPSDWVKNSSVMKEIYGNAEIVICAACSENVHETFLSTVKGSVRPALSSSTVNLNRSKEPAKDLYLRLRCLPESLAEKFPLDKRAWTFQERFLANRCVRYSLGQASWECVSGSASEFYHVEEIDGHRHDQHQWSGPQWRKNADALRVTNNLTMDDWLEVIHIYTRKDITFSKDRLPAISGLASKYADKFKCCYLAGLWKSDFLHQLCWWADKEEQSERQDWLVAGAPSWSWASLSCGINLSFSKDLRLLQESEAQIVKIHCVPSTSNPFGTVCDDSFICLNGSTLDTDLRYVAKTTQRPMLREFSGRHGPDIRLDSPLRLQTDTDNEISDLQDDTRRQAQIGRWQRASSIHDLENPSGFIAPVKLFSIGTTETRGLLGLILSPHPMVPATFVRIGFISFPAFHEEKWRNETVKIM